jgi:6-pyruvoyltetrahydropterin/6-carboxytetrahydropterin synthase
MDKYKYKVRVTKDYLTFCSAHFICFEGTKCECLHGHNYRVAAEIEAPLNQDFLVFDFIALKRILRDITNELDHRMLVPLKSQTLEIEHDEQSVRIRHGQKEWGFPREDCVLLPVENTTAELLARWLAGRLRDELTSYGKAGAVKVAAPEILRVEVEETPGQSAVYETVG